MLISAIDPLPPYGVLASSRSTLAQLTLNQITTPQGYRYLGVPRHAAGIVLMWAVNRGPI